MKAEYLTEDQRWVTFYPKFCTGFYIEKAGYFDERPVVHVSLTSLIVLALLPALLVHSLWFLLLTPLLIFGWGQMFIHLPIRTGIQDCESAAWGINYHGNILWIYIGGGGNFEGGRKWKTIYMPWDRKWVRTSTLLKNKEWFHETKSNRVKWEDTEEYGTQNWLDKNQWQETHEYTDNYDGKVVNATISVKEREWRPRGWQFTNLFAKVVRDIEVEFDEEVGKEKGSWKGGVLGCGQTLLPNETPLECLKRMEKDKNF